MKGPEHLLICECYKARIYGVYHVVAGLKMCYRCGRDEFETKHKIHSVIDKGEVKTGSEDNNR